LFPLSRDSGCCEEIRFAAVKFKPNIKSILILLFSNVKKTAVSDEHGSQDYFLQFFEQFMQLPEQEPVLPLQIALMAKNSPIATASKSITS